MKLLEAKKHVEEYDDLENAIKLAREKIINLESDLTFTKRARDGFDSGSGSYQYHNAEVILVRRNIKYWKGFIQQAHTRRTELIGAFEGRPLKNNPWQIWK